MAVFADFTDVAAIWRPLTDTEISVVIARIEQASQQVRDIVPTVDARIAAGSLSADTVRFVVRDMVFRLVSHDMFVRQQSVTVDDGSKSVTFDAAVSKGEMFITESELAALLGASSAVYGSAFEIALGS